MTIATAQAAAPGVARAGGTPPVVSVRDVAKSFPRRRGWMESLRHPRSAERVPALRALSLDVHAQEFFGLLGANGAGKTTLFKILSTLILPDAGTATVLGHDVAREPAAVRRLLAPVIADERSLLWRLSARENLELYAGLHGIAWRDRQARVEEVLRAVELTDTGSKMVGQFSSGMKQRLLIARALLARPSVLLLDEPTRSLDPLSARTFRRFLRDEIVRAQGCTVLLATHSAEEALDLCDRVGVLDRGRLLATGTVPALERRYGGDRYRLWTNAPDHPELARLRQEGVIAGPAVPGVEEGWSGVDLAIPGGAEATARMLQRLAAAGVPVARFEAVPLSLADLLERVVADAAGREGGEVRDA